MIKNSDIESSYYDKSYANMGKVQADKNNEFRYLEICYGDNEKKVFKQTKIVRNVNCQTWRLTHLNLKLLLVILNTISNFEFCLHKFIHLFF